MTYGAFNKQQVSDSLDFAPGHPFALVSQLNYSLLCWIVDTYPNVPESRFQKDRDIAGILLDDQVQISCDKIWLNYLQSSTEYYSR